METINRDYKEFIDMLESSELEAKDVYQEIMNKEKDALEAINKIAETRAKQVSGSGKSFFKLSLSDLYFSLIRNMRNIVVDCLAVQDVRELPLIILDGERKIYVGIVLVLIALFLFFIAVST